MTNKTLEHSAHMLEGGRAVVLRAMLPLVDDHSERKWIHVALEGQWCGHPSGKFQFTKKVFRKIVDNFNAAKNPIPLTYGHPDSERAAMDGAAGWIHDLKIRPDGLWALTEFTKRSAGMIRDGEHRWCSCVVVFDSVDRVTGDEIGPELFEVGLVLSPFIDGMQPIQLSRLAARIEAQRDKSMSDKDLFAAALKALPDEATSEQIVQWVDAKKALDAVEGGEPSSEEPPAEEMAASNEADGVQLVGPDPEPVAEEAQASMADDAIAQLAELLGSDSASALALLQERLSEVAGLLSGESSGEAAAEAGLARVAALKRQVDAKKAELMKKDEQITKLGRRIEALEDDKVNRRIEEAVKAGHVLDKDRDKFVALAKSDSKLFERFLKDAADDPAVPQPVTAGASPGARTEPSDVSEDELETHLLALKNVIKDPEKRREFAVQRVKSLRAAN